MSVAILGAGISGLVAARRLRERGVDFELLEADARPGGLCQSDVVDGYVMDRSGGHIVFSKSEKAMRYYHDLFADEPLVKSDRNTRILLDGRYIPYPFENGLAALSAEDRARCVAGALKAQFDRSCGAAKPANFADWIRWRVGDGIADLFMEPYNRKIWKLDDLAEMGIDWVDGRVPEAPLADVVQAALGRSTVGYAHQAVFWYPLTGGFQSITDRIARSVADRLRLGARVTDVTRRDGRLHVNGRGYDAVISTIPLPVLAPLVDGLDADTCAAAGGLGFVSLACFMFGIAAQDAQPWSWLYLPRPEQGPANRVTYLSNYSPRNAPGGRASLLAEVTYRGKLDVTREFVADLKRRLATQGLFRAENVSVVEWRDNRFAYIHFGRDFTARREQAIRGLEAYGIVPLGRFGRYNYYNTDLCILEALEAADRLADRLTGDARLTPVDPPEKTRGMDVSVVIPTRNGGPRLLRVLEQVRAQQTTFAVEHVVIDSRSSDGSDDAARRAGFRVLSVDPREFDHGATRDQAIAATSGRAIALLVQDAVPVGCNWLERLARPLLEDPQAAGSFSRQLPIPGGNPILAARLRGWIAGRDETRRAQLAAGRPWDSLTPFERLDLIAFDNVSSCIKRDCWLLQPFGRRPFGEDLGWSTWAIRAGYAIRFEARSVVEHSHDRSCWHEARRIYCDHRNLNRLLGMRTVATIGDAWRGSRAALPGYLRLLDEAGLAPDELARRRKWARGYARGEALAQWLAPIVNAHGERGLLGWLDRRIRRGI